MANKKKNIKTHKNEDYTEKVYKNVDRPVHCQIPI